MMASTMRTDQLLANFGYCSRREAVGYVKAGHITDLDGNPVERADERVDPLQTLVFGSPVPFPTGLLVMLNKPAGYVCSHDANEGPRVYDLLPEQWSRRNPAITTVGRLDKDATGLLLITDQGPLVQRWTSPKHHLPKIYDVTTSQPIPETAAAIFASGQLILRSETVPCQPAALEIHGPQQARITLHEGRYHQVKRMFASQGCPVETLHRSGFGRLLLTNLAPGEWAEVAVDQV
jgi:16S rRNA pseudouridine516 synthase